MIRPLSIAFALIALNSSVASSAVIFDNGGPLTGVASDIMSDGNVSVQVADDFTLASGAGPITGIRWYGLYDTVGAPPSDSFTIEFYADDSGMPASAPLATFTPSSVSRVDTGVLNPLFPIYRYEASLPPLALPAGMRHWVSIYNTPTPTDDFWFFSKSALSGDVHLTAPIGSGTWVAASGANESELAFQLLGGAPEPATFVLMLFAAVTIAARRFPRSLNS